MAWLDKTVIIHKTVISLHTPETKRHSKIWVPKGATGPVKSHVQASRNKQTVLIFFTAASNIHTKVVFKGTMFNAAYIVEVMDIFMQKMRKKRLVKVELERDFQLAPCPRSMGRSRPGLVCHQRR